MRMPDRDDGPQAEPRRRGARWTRRSGHRRGDEARRTNSPERQDAGKGMRSTIRDRDRLSDGWVEGDDDG